MIKKTNRLQSAAHGVLMLLLLASVFWLLWLSDQSIPSMTAAEVSQLSESYFAEEGRTILLAAEDGEAPRFVLPALPAAYQLLFADIQGTVEVELNGEKTAIEKNYEAVSLPTGRSNTVRLLPQGDQDGCRVYLIPQKRCTLFTEIKLEMRLISIGINLAAVVVAFFLYFYKKTEKYLLVFLLYLLTNLVRVFVMAYPMLFSAFPLSLLNWHVPVFSLPMERTALVQRSIHLLLVSFLQTMLVFSLLRPACVRRYVRLYLVLSLLCLGAVLVFPVRIPQMENSFLALRWLLFLTECTVVALSTGFMTPGLTLFLFFRCLYIVLFSIYQGNTVIAPLFSHVRYFFDGGPVTESLYVSGVLIYLSEKYAQKYAEADQLKRELTETNSYLEQAVADKTVELSRSLQEVTALKEQQDRFVSNVAHDLKTPMFSILGYHDMIRSELTDLPEDAEQHMAIIERNVYHMQSLLDRLLLISRLDSHRIRLNRSVFLLGECVEEIYLMLKPKLDAKAVRYEASISEDIMLYGDYGYLKECFSNMLENAAYWVEESGLIRVSAETAGENPWIKIGFYNSGSHLSAETLPHVFDRQFSTKPRSENSYGLGLAICKEITELHGGTIRVQNEGDGVLFTMLLPVCEGEL